jgi:hypothetical protein
VITRRQLIAIAAPMLDLHPDWQQAGILSQLQTRADTWTGTDAEFYAEMMRIAADPRARTPGAFNATPPTPTPAPAPARSSYGWGERICYICGRDRSSCIARKAWEIKHHVPDPHDFETIEEADWRAEQADRLGYGAGIGTARQALQQARKAAADARPVIETDEPTGDIP